MKLRKKEVSDIESISDAILMMKNDQIIYEGNWKEDNIGLEEFYLQQFEEEGEEGF